MPQPAETLPDVDFTQADLEAVKPILDTLDVSWWLENQHHQALAKAYALGRNTPVS